MVDILGGFSDLAMTQGAGQWISLAINMIVSTIIGGIVILVVAAVMSKASGESVGLGNAFVAALVINIINFPIIMGLIGPLVASIPLLLFIFPILVWIIVVKIFFKGFSWLHVLVVAIVAFFVNAIIGVQISGMVFGIITSAVPTLV